jgi:L-ascorbate metabolism protein UlaG (beta-lactamase superfamily)
VLLTKFGHACVRLEKDGQVIVIDPGTFSESESLQDAVAVLITHEHADHVDPELLVAAQTGNPALVVHTNSDVVAQLAQKGVTAQPVAPGNTFSVAGFDIRVVGGEHAEIYDGLPGCANVGFIVDGAAYHPGDSLFVPDGDIDTLLVPVSAPWLKLREAIEFVRAVAPRRAHPIHDAMLSEIGVNNVDTWIGAKGGSDYSRIPSGESVELGG